MKYYFEREKEDPFEEYADMIEEALTEGINPWDTWIPFVFARRFIPNFWSLYEKYVAQQYPYTSTTLPNYRQVDTCYNCQHGIKEILGAEVVVTCGLVAVWEWDLDKSEPMVSKCDLYEREVDK